MALKPSTVTASEVLLKLKKKVKALHFKLYFTPIYMTFYIKLPKTMLCETKVALRKPAYPTWGPHTISRARRREFKPGRIRESR